MPSGKPVLRLYCDFFSVQADSFKGLVVRVIFGSWLFWTVFFQIRWRGRSEPSAECGEHEQFRFWWVGTSTMVMYRSGAGGFIHSPLLLLNRMTAHNCRAKRLLELLQFCQQRNDWKILTTMQRISSWYDLIWVRACKKESACNVTVIEHPKYGDTLQF